MIREYLQKQKSIKSLLTHQLTASNPVLSKHQAYQKILIHASTYDDVDELLEGLNASAAKGCGHDATILERPLRLAFLNSAVSVARYLMTNTSVSVNSIGPSLAWKLVSWELLQILIDKGWDINKHDTDMGDGHGESLLHYVCEDETPVSWALENGARPDDPMPTDPYECRPLLDTIARKGSVASFKLPTSEGARRGFRTLHSAVDAAFDGTELRLEMIRYLVDDVTLDVIALDAPGELPNYWGTPLCYAARWSGDGSENVVRFLLEGS
ncbi:hypothetical protein KCU77_g1522, partial [Aureobasidium melanogenum]